MLQADPEPHRADVHHVPCRDDRKCSRALAPGLPHAQERLLHLHLQPVHGRLPLSQRPHYTFSVKPHQYPPSHLQNPQPCDDVFLPWKPEISKQREHRALPVRPVAHLVALPPPPPHLSAVVCVSCSGPCLCCRASWSGGSVTFCLVVLILFGVKHQISSQ